MKIGRLTTCWLVTIALLSVRADATPRKGALQVMSDALAQEHSKIVAAVQQALESLLLRSKVRSDLRATQLLQQADAKLEARRLQILNEADRSVDALMALDTQRLLRLRLRLTATTLDAKQRQEIVDEINRLEQERQEKILAIDEEANKKFERLKQQGMQLVDKSAERIGLALSTQMKQRAQAHLEQLKRDLKDMRAMIQSMRQSPRTVQERISPTVPTVSVAAPSKPSDLLETVVRKVDSVLQR